MAVLAIVAAVAAAAPAVADPGTAQTMTPHPSQADLDRRFLDDLGLGGIRVTSVEEITGDAHRICAILKAGSTEAQVVKMAMEQNRTLTEANAETLVESAEGVYCPQLFGPGALA